MGALMRFPDWRVRLQAYLRAEAGQRFRPGAHDCALHGAGAVLAMTGEDFAANYRGQYQTIEAGLALLQAQGFADHVALAAHHLPEIHPGRARVGDLVAFESEHGPILAVNLGPRVSVRMIDGLGLVARDKAERAFQCG